MTTERPEKLGDRFVELNEGRCISMPAFVELARAVLDKGGSMRFRVRGKSMTPFIKDGKFRGHNERLLTLAGGQLAASSLQPTALSREQAAIGGRGLVSAPNPQRWGCYHQCC